MKKIWLSILAVVIVVGGGAFYGGMEYAKSKSPRRLSQADFQNSQNLSPEERQQRLQELSANTGAGFRGGTGGMQRGGGGFTAGEIIAKDDPSTDSTSSPQAGSGQVKSVTIKLQDGGSKIIFISDATEITKSAEGFLNDLEVGKNVVVNGAVNSDGSVTAQTIQLRPLPPNRGQ